MSWHTTAPDAEGCLAAKVREAQAARLYGRAAAQRYFKASGQ